jgi:hypothetical protein
MSANGDTARCGYREVAAQAIRRTQVCTTLSICSWALVGLGVAMTSWLFPVSWAFLPYVLLSFSIASARRVGTRAVALVLVLASVCVGFWFFWDADFVRFTTLNLNPAFVVAVECLVSVAAWPVIRWVERGVRAGKTG